jgi:hypothetical protein
MQTAVASARAGFQKPSDSGKAEAVTENVPFHSLASQIQNLRGCPVTRAPVWGGRKGGRRAGRRGGRRGGRKGGRKGGRYYKGSTMVDAI